ncbi:MAG: MATE family efflux transporter [Calditrichaeota bacterium]|nr:MATE family efflux transporter [Calditrichota bacterium]MCB0267711.1 MATE family efflux transporter [Calditrichota bacterium]MCB0285645.1 MATE family efflux transporter [Calditrichota bacterium]MCB9068431.1 MATE family efflux transporter [Calditrichia bacterium]
MSSSQKSPLKNILKTSLPAVIDLSSQTVAWLIEAILIGNISAAALAGVGLALQIVILTFTVVLTFVVGASIIINQYLGAEDHWNANHVLAQAMMVGTIMAFVISLLWYFGGTQVFLAIREEEPSARIYGVQYLKIISYFGPLVILNFMGLGILRMVGDTVVTMKINLFTNILHLTLASILIFGLFGMPRMEAEGAALAVGIAHSIAFFITLYMLRSRKVSLFLSFTEYATPNFETFKRLYKLGLPTTVEQLVWAFGQLVLSFYAGLLGIVVLAAHQVFVRVQSVLTMAFQGFGLASMSLVGRSIGAGDDDAAIKAGWQTGWVALATAMLIGAGLMLTEQWWFSIFTKNEAVVTFGTSAVIVLAIIQMPKAMNMVFTGNLRGGGDLNWLMWLAISSVTIFEIIGSYYFAFVCELSLIGIWMVQGMDEASRLFCNFWRFHQRKWKIKDML